MSAVLAGGCYAAHGLPPGPGLSPGPAADTGPDAPIRGIDTDGDPVRDVGGIDSGGGPFDAGDRCAELFALLRAGTTPEEIGCDGRSFPRDCSTPVGECCVLALECATDPGDGGHVTTTLSCYDWCDQSCGAMPWADCTLMGGCEWFDPGACGPAPPGFIEGPVCIASRAAACSGDEDCSDGRRCRSFWIHPCVGIGCDACGGEERRCSY